MDILLYSATGCARCKMIQDYMAEQNIPHLEKDIKKEARDDFQQLYRKNRNAIFRTEDGIEFPIIVDGETIRQGIAASLAYLQDKNKLDGFFTPGTLRREWVNGIYVSGGNAEYATEFLEVLRLLKGYNLKLQLETDGRNSQILDSVIKEKLVDRIIVNVLGNEEIYKLILGEEVSIEDVKSSFAMATQIKDHKFLLTVAPVKRADGTISYITPDEAAEAAELVENATENKKNPFLIKAFDPKLAKQEEFKKIEKLLPNDLFPYRSKTRNYQVFADIEKN